MSEWESQQETDPVTSVTPPINIKFVTHVNKRFVILFDGQVRFKRKI